MYINTLKISLIIVFSFSCSSNEKNIRKSTVIKNTYVVGKKNNVDKNIDTKILEKRNAKFNKKLFNALKRNKLNLALKAIAQGAELDTYMGEITALHYACKKNRMDIAMALLEAGANTNLVAKDYSGSPLIAAIRNINVELVQALISYNAKPDYFFTLKHKKKGKVLIEKYVTPLYFSTVLSKLNFDLIEILLKARANPNITTSLGNFPLKAAVYARSLILVQLLVKYGANTKMMIKSPSKVSFKMSLVDYARHLEKSVKNKKEKVKLGVIVDFFTGEKRIENSGIFNVKNR